MLGMARKDTSAKTRNKSTEGEDALRQSGMMAHLLDALNAGEDIGHYGQLVFAMVARHFMDEEEVVAWLQKSSGFSEAQARGLYEQVQGRDYNPPRRERILEWQKQQDFPICPTPDDPDTCNLYRELRFPDDVYQDISEYHEQKAD